MKALRREIKPLFILGLAVVVMVMALSTGWEILFRLFYTILGVVVISFLWAWANVRWLSYKHEIKTNRAQVGGQIEERLTLENSSWLPKLWLEIRDHSTLIGRRGNRVVALGSWARRSFTMTTPCLVRGEFNLGPVTVISGDPFGLFRRQRKLNISGKVIVYPAITELYSFARLPGELPGGSVQTQHTPFATPNAAGVRDYQPGDSLNRIHWLSSARQRRLMTKEFDLDPLSDVWLVLDLDDQVQVGSGQDSTEEWAVSVAATLANYFAGQQRQVGLITQRRVLAADRGDRQLHKLLELLAVARPESSIPLEQLVLSEETRFVRGATVVVITPSIDERWLATCSLLVSRGVTVLTVLLEASTFGSKGSPLLSISSLAAVGIRSYLLRRGDDLAAALAEPSTPNTL
jgi:uncharacterized protein (DUF58 family)